MSCRRLITLSLLALLLGLVTVPAGAETLCFGQPATIQASGGLTTGTPGPDVIIGTAGTDVIRGLGGNDRICGLGGNDELWGMGGRDRLSGGPGDDVLRGGAGTKNILNGDAGADRLIIGSFGDTARGGAGDDRIDARQAGFAVLRGGGGRDTIFSGYRDDLDAGAQQDHCGLAPGVPGTNCETLELLCGTQDVGPVLMPSPSVGYGDFDGDGQQDTVSVWHSGTVWQGLLSTNAGFEDGFTLPTGPAEQAGVIGGYDINGDGIDEILLKVGAGAHADIIGLYAFHQPDGSPATGLSCAVKPVTFSAGPPAAAEFPIGASIGTASGLACLPSHSLRALEQETADGTHYTQTRYDYDYLPGFGTGFPHLGMPAASLVSLVRPTDQTAIDAAGTLACGGLGL